MRKAIVDALRGYKPDDLDGVLAEPLWLGDEGAPQTLNRERFFTLLLMALREHELEIRDLRQRVVALETKVGQ